MRYSTANADLRLQYRSVVPKAVVLALALALQTMLTVEKINVVPYKPAGAAEAITIEDIPETQQPEPDIPEMERPAVVEVEEATSEDVNEDVVIASTELVEHVEHIDIVAPIDRDPAPDEFVPYDTPPRITVTVPAKYPESALQTGMEGTVYVKILIGTNGVPIRAIVAKGMGFGFDEAALQAAMQCRFTPAMQRDRAVKVWVSIPFQFKIKR